MKKTFLTSAFAIMLIGGYFSANAGTQNYMPCDTTCNTSWVQQIYNKAKDGTVSTYDKVADGTLKVYDKTADGTVSTYNKVADGTVNTYNKVANETVKTFDKTKNAVRKGANTVKQDWNKIF